MNKPEYTGTGHFVAADTIWGENCRLGHASIVGSGDESAAPSVIASSVEIGAFCFIARNISIGCKTHIDHYCRVESGARVGRATKILYGAQIFANAKIGDQCIVGGDISERVIIEDSVTYMGRMAHAHRNPNLNWDRTDEPSPIVRAGSVIGVDALLIGNVEIGPFSYIGAGEIVRHNIPPHSVYLNGRITPISAWRGYIKARVPEQDKNA